MVRYHPDDEEEKREREWLEPDDECDCADHAPVDKYWVCPKCDAEWFPEDAE